MLLAPVCAALGGLRLRLGGLCSNLEVIGRLLERRRVNACSSAVPRPAAHTQKNVLRPVSLINSSWAPPLHPPTYTQLPDITTQTAHRIVLYPHVAHSG